MATKPELESRLAELDRLIGQRGKLPPGTLAERTRIVQELAVKKPTVKKAKGKP